MPYSMNYRNFQTRRTKMPNDKKPHPFNEAFARGLRPRPNQDELQAAIELLEQHSMFEVAAILSEIEVAEHG